MARSNVKTTGSGAQVWELAERQHGIVARSDLLAVGYTTSAIDHRVATGRLHVVSRGVYAVGWPGLTPERRWTIAVLSCAPEASLSHRSAAALWGIGREGRLIELSVRRRCNHRRMGIRARCRLALPEEDVVERRGIPVTVPARTLLDLATVLGASALERAVNDADKLDLIDPEALRARLEGFRGEPGVVALRLLLDRQFFRLSDSDLEVHFRRAAERAGLPMPRTKVMVNGFEVDFFWPDLGLVVETDGLRYHRTPSSQARDRIRDQAHTMAGLTTLRFTHHQVRYEGAHVSKVLRATAATLPRCPTDI
jgi:very-short-patch-repair endonuclease